VGGGGGTGHILTKDAWLVPIDSYAD